MAQSRSRVAFRTILRIACDLLRLVSAAVRSHAHLAAENLFLRKELALYVERQVKPHRADDATRDCPRRAVVADRLASHSHGREAGHPHPMASKGVPVVLAMEVHRLAGDRDCRPTFSG